MKTEIELKPCPFCGDDVLTVYEFYMIQCQTCKTIFITPQGEHKKNLLEIWNQRKEYQNEHSGNHFKSAMQS
jgi:hypothetical protein